jgi:glycosyltransferase domain-containing protein
MLGQKFTLVVPTYNRPADLARLLAYLGRERPEFAVLVLDSSAPPARAENAAALARAPFAKRLEFDSAMPPWEKFWRGAEQVDTEYCAFCADDDLVLVRSIAPIVEFLEKNRDYGMAHGWYFSFYDAAQFGLTATVYRGASIDEDSALARLHTLFRRYEALTYGVHRTAVLRKVMQSVQSVRTMLGRELLGGAVAVVAGKAARLPLFYYGRSLGPSQPYTGWHPLEMLLDKPASLYEDYTAYRAILVDALAGTESAYSREQLATILDLIHFRYLSDYVKPAVMDYLIGQAMAKRPKADAIQGMWAVLAGTDGGVAAAARRSPLLRRIARRLLPAGLISRLKRAAPAAAGMKSVRTTTAAGAAREYLLYDAFMSALPGATPPDEQAADLLRALDNY